jgi:hypothetical protein
MSFGATGTISIQSTCSDGTSESAVVYQDGSSLVTESAPLYPRIRLEHGLCKALAVRHRTISSQALPAYQHLLMLKT